MSFVERLSSSWRFKGKPISLDLGNRLCREVYYTVSLSQSIHYRMFHCITILSELMHFPLFISLVDDVYAIGGYNGVKTVDVVERYNPDEGTWKEVAPLVFGRSVPGIAVAYLWPVQSTMKSFWEPESQL